MKTESTKSKQGNRIVVKHEDYAKDRLKYHRQATRRRKVVVVDENGLVAFVLGG